MRPEPISIRLDRHVVDELRKTALTLSAELQRPITWVDLLKAAIGRPKSAQDWAELIN